MPHQVLIVDGTAQRRAALKDFLGRGLGYEVVAVSGVGEGIEAAMERGFDLAILSASLSGGTSGAEAFRRLTSIRPELQAVFLVDADAEPNQSDDLVRYSVPPEHVIAWSSEDRSALTRLIISILGPPVA